MKTRALDSYTGKSGARLNCAQSVAFAGKSEFGLSDAELESFGGCGGGRAPDGLCGAIYAASSLIAKKSSLHAEQALSEFKDAIGEVHCRAIRGARVHPCMDCVAQAAILAEKFINTAK